MIELKISADAILLMLACNAGVVYVARQRRAVHPQGQFDSAGRWYPYAKTEHRRCCDQIRSPSRRWPYSLMLHCRTAKHVARLFSVPEKDVRRAAKAFTKLEEPELAVEAEKALRSGR
jgi:hypothetical protein